MGTVCKKHVLLKDLHIDFNYLSYTSILYFAKGFWQDKLGTKEVKEETLTIRLNLWLRFRLVKHFVAFIVVNS